MKQNTLKEVKVVALLLGLLVLPVLITSYMREEVSVHAPISSESLDELAQAYRKSGIDQFFTVKRVLQKRVSFNLKNDDDSKAQMAAMNIAVYMFPELLHETHLEKKYAEDNFKPLQEKIEALPGTREAQDNFEELRNLVWNYENPKQNEQGLSEYANEMLKVYGALSWK
jgi:hypothetical protein